MKIIVASKNPVKIQAVVDGFARMFPGQPATIEGVSVDSGVDEQPTSDSETYQGAYNRALHASQTVPDADFWVGLEGGIQAKDSEMESYAWIVVRGKNGQIGKGRTGTLFLPPQIATLIAQGKELSEADDIVFGRTNSQQTNGAVGLLTGDVIVRSTYYSEAVVLALIPFKNPKLYD
jgi:inosine/xanthosine triphosphatase